MDFEFPPDTLMLRDMLQRFIQKEVRPLEMKYYTSGGLSPEERARLRKAVEQLGLWGLMVPEEFGGGGLDTVTACLIEEELGGTFIPVEIGNIPVALYACEGEQVDRYLEPALAGDRRAILAVREPGVQSFLPLNWSTAARPDGEEFILNGKKVLGTPPSPEDFFIVFSKIQNGSTSQELTAFLLEPGTAGLSLLPGKEFLIEFQDCRMGHDQILGKPGSALEFTKEEAPRAWVQTGARYVGMVERLIEMATEHARDWMVFEAPLAARPAIQRMLADLRIEVESSRWLVYHTAWLIDTGKSDRIRCSAAQVRLATGIMLQRAVDTITMIYAGPGPTAQIEPQRLVQSVVPPEALQLAIEHTRAFVAADMLHLSKV
ncbi:MAG TPA: acyl-CoA dehydrogenase family protein [Anaerolineales bacterium]